MSVNLPEPPVLSALGRRVLAAADERDRGLREQTGMDRADAVEYLDGLDADERTALMWDGLRWRHHCHTLDARRAAVMASHAVSAGLDWAEFSSGHMSYAERYAPPRSYLRRVAEHGEYHGGPVQWSAPTYRKGAA